MASRDTILLVHGIPEGIRIITLSDDCNLPCVNYVHSSLFLWSSLFLSTPARCQNERPRKIWYHCFRPMSSISRLKFSTAASTSIPAASSSIPEKNNTEVTSHCPTDVLLVWWKYVPVRDPKQSPWKHSECVKPAWMQAEIREEMHLFTVFTGSDRNMIMFVFSIDFISTCFSPTGITQSTVTLS